MSIKERVTAELVAAQIAADTVLDLLTTEHAAYFDGKRADHADAVCAVNKVITVSCIISEALQSIKELSEK